MKKVIVLFQLLSLFCFLPLSAQTIEPLLQNLVQENRKTVAFAKGKKLPVTQPGIVNGVDTALIMKRTNVSFYSDGSIRRLGVIGTLAEGNNCPEEELKALGIEIFCKIGNLVFINVPIEAFDTLCTMKEFASFGADKVLRLDNNVARTTNGVSFVTGETLLPALEGSKYDGTGVIVGVIDDGIDFNHIAFKDSNGKTRIKAAMTVSKNSEGTFEVTTYNTEEDINTLTTGTTYDSHGTHTAATAAGSCIAESKLQGMTPGADLVLFDISGYFNKSVLAYAANKIFEYAKTINKPVVINFSIGSTAGFYDGTDIVAQAFNTLTSEQPGRIVCVSAGNSADKKSSIDATVNNGEILKTVFDTKSSNEQYTSYDHGLFIQANSNANFSARLMAVDITTGQEYSLAEKPLYNSSNAITNVECNVQPHGDGSIYFFQATSGFLKFNDKNIRLGIELKATTNNQRFTINDGYSNSNYAFIGEKGNSVLTGYKDGDGEMSINPIACTDGVISVGAYRDRDTWQSIDNYNYYSPTINQYPQNSVVPFSSYGVDYLGKMRPDVVAPGAYIISAFNAYDQNYFSGEGINNKEPIEGKKSNISHVLKGKGIGDGTRPYFYGAMSGTSMSAPMVTGIVALWLQANPNLTVANVREIIQKTSARDIYTRFASNIPSGNIVQAGTGKIDALRGIEYILNTYGGKSIPTDVDISMTNNLATFSSTEMLDFRDPEMQPKAYIAEQLNSSTLTFKRVFDRVPANTGLLINAPAGNYKIPIATNASEITNNYLYGTAESPVTIINKGECYVLSSKEGKVGFYQNAAGLTIPAGKAYLKLPEDAMAASHVVGISLSDEISIPDNSSDAGIAIDDIIIGNLVIDYGNTTGIEEINSENQPAAVYDLSGRRAKRIGKGLYIMNGKKVVM